MIGFTCPDQDKCTTQSKTQRSMLKLKLMKSKKNFGLNVSRNLYSKKRDSNTENNFKTLLEPRNFKVE